MGVVRLASHGLETANENGERLFIIFINNYLNKCNRFAADGKPVVWTGPEGRAADAKGRMQSMAGTASAWEFKMPPARI